MIRDQEILDQFLDTVRRFVREKLIPLEEEVSETGVVPDEVLAQLRELGLYGMTVS